MFKPLVILATLLAAAPLVASADPMSVGDGPTFAATSSSATISNSTRIVADTDEDSADAAPEAPMPAAAPRPLRRDAASPGTAPHISARPHSAAEPAHKKSDATRWQSLLPGVMK